MKGPAAAMAPGARHRRYRKRGMHIHRPIALAGEAEAQPKERARRGADELREFLDLGDVEASDRGGPCWCFRSQVAFHVGVEIGELGEILAVRQAVAQQHVHDGAGQRPIAARTNEKRQVCLLHRGVAVDVDDDQFGAAFLTGPHRMGHDVDLRHHRVGAPDDDTIALGHLFGIDPSDHPRTGDVARPRRSGADGVILQRIAPAIAQPVDAVALHVAHGPGIEIGPNGLGTDLVLDGPEAGDNLVERLVPGDLLPPPCSLGADPAHGMGQAIGVMDALGIAGDLLANDAGGVGIILGAAHPADRVRVHDFNVERAGRRAIVRADTAGNAGGEWRVHGA